MFYSFNSRMRSLVVFCAVAVLAFGGPLGGSSSEEHHGPHRKSPKGPEPPFLAGVSKEGKKAFYALDKNVSRAEYWEEVAAWAEQYNVTKAVEEFEAKQAELFAERNENINALLGNLTEAFSQLVALEEDLELSFAQLGEHIQQLFESLEPEETKALRFILSLYAPPRPPHHKPDPQHTPKPHHTPKTTSRPSSPAPTDLVENILLNA